LFHLQIIIIIQVFFIPISLRFIHSFSCFFFYQFFCFEILVFVMCLIVIVTIIAV
jgi:hypothetical protein